MARPDARDMFRRYEAAKTLRSPWEDDWKMAAAYCLPRQYSAWGSNGPAATNGKAKDARRYAFDNTGMLALPKYVSILNRLATPQSQRWHKLAANDPHLMRSRSVREYFEALTERLFTERYAARARFEQTTGEVYTALGVYGTGPCFVGQRRRTPADAVGGLGYIACPLRDVFLLVDDEGNPDTIFRRFWLTARGFVQKFGIREPEYAPPCVAAELRKPNPSDTEYFEFVHVVHPRDDYEPHSVTLRRMAYVSSYIAVKGQAYVGEEEGYLTLPYLTPRTHTEAGEAYGYSPALQALPALGSTSQIKKTLLKQGQKAVDPVLLAHDDGVLNGGMDLRPGATNYGGVDAQGRRLVHALEAGNFQVGDVLLQDERKDINDSFFVTLFQILTETPEMTATEVIERVAEKASLLAPTMGRIQAEFLGPCIEREIAVLDEMGKLADIEVPGELVEARGEYSIQYTSPLAKGQYAEEVSGFMRAFEFALNAAQQTQDNSPLDHFDLDSAIPELVDRMSGPARWMRSPAKVEQLRAARAQSAQQTQVLEQLPAIASAAKTAADMQNGGGK